MAEVPFIFGVTVGMFVFLVGIIFAARARRYRQGYTSPVDASSHNGGHGE